MNANEQKAIGARSRKRAFSLIEVTIAIGIVAFSLVPLLGVIPVGLGVTQDAMMQTARSHIIKQISSDLGALPFSKITAYLAVDQYYDYEGNRVESASSSSIFVATMSSALPNYPGSSSLTGLDEHMKRVIIKIRRVVESPTGGSRTTLVVCSSSGQP